MRKNAVVDSKRCVVSLCAASFGGCPAVAACTHLLLEQDGKEEPPMLLSAVACTGCGKCVSACPAGAIEVTRGV